MMQTISHLEWYKLQSSILPQPLAFIMGRIARADRLSEQVDCIRRAAETLTRYIAVTQVASLAYSDDPSAASGLINEAPKDIAWGWYTEVVRKISKLESDHPLKNFIAKGMSDSMKNGAAQKASGLSAMSKLESLRSTRNSMTDHSLVGLDEHKAKKLLDDSNWEVYLRESIEAFGPLLRLPLVVISARKYVKTDKCERYRVLHYKGENDPFPLEVVGKSGLVEQDIPYLVVGQRLISLSPGMVVDSWAPHRTGLYFIDGIKEGRPRYRTIFIDDLKYRSSAEGWPQLQWCAPDDYEQIVRPEERNLQKLLDDEFKSVHSEIAAAVPFQ